jgi:hypothetical protein
MKCVHGNIRVTDVPCIKFIKICQHTQMISVKFNLNLLGEVNQNEILPRSTESRESSVGVVLGYGLDDRGSRVRFPVGARNVSLHHRLENGAHPASYTMGTRGSFPGGKAAGV